jgi:hypothetical protein
VVHERLAYYLLELDAASDAEVAARAAVELLPADRAAARARALATHAQTLMHAGDEAAASRRAQQARVAARAADAPWVEADALVTLGMLAERQGEPAQALDLFTQAYREAQDLNMLGVELRAAFQVARAQLESGDLAAAAATAHEGGERADAAGLGLAPYGLDLQYLHYLAHFSDGCWNHAQELADGFGVRVTTPAEARLSAMALFLDVARAAWRSRAPGLAGPFWPGDSFGAPRARPAGRACAGAGTRDRTGRGGGHPGRAGRQGQLRASSPGAPVAWPPGIARRAPSRRRRLRPRRRGDRSPGADRRHTRGAAFPMAQVRAGRTAAAGWPGPRQSGPGQGRNDPQAWQAVVETFGPAFTTRRPSRAGGWPRRWPAGQRAEAERGGHSRWPPRTAGRGAGRRAA